MAAEFILLLTILKAQDVYIPFHHIHNEHPLTRNTKLLSQASVQKKVLCEV